MADLRIYQLGSVADDIATYSFIVDKDGIPQALNISHADLFQPVNDALQALSNDKADKANVLQKDNTTPYSPVGQYNPATKKYVDDIGIKVVSRGTILANGSVFLNKGIAVTSALRPGTTSTYTVTHNLGNTNYMVVANVRSTSTSPSLNKIGAIYRANNSFTVTLADDDSGNAGDFDFAIAEFTSALT